MTGTSRGVARRVLGRLRVRGKLNLLLALPLAAVILVAVPFVIVQVDDADSAAGTASQARQAREIGRLVSDVQRERLLTAAYLNGAVPFAEVAEEQQTVDRTAASMTSALGGATTAELRTALLRLGSLTDIRNNVQGGNVSLESVGRTYHAINEALIDALRLVPNETSDAVGTRQLTALEALLRAGEQQTLRGMALILAVRNPEAGLSLLDDMSDRAQISTERFVSQADIEQARIVVAVEDSDAGNRVNELVARATDPRDEDAATLFVAEAYAAVDAQSELRRTSQARVITEIADSATARAEQSRVVAWVIGGGAALLFLLVAALAVVVSRSIANPMRRLTAAATDVADLAEAELVRVADTETPAAQVPKLQSIDVTTRDEVGELADAFNRVQATAANLVERQALTRRNVSQMFANVARRTQNLVGRQLALVDELERDEQDPRLLTGLYRLDHLSTRLRRTADNLLVVAGARTDTAHSGPADLPTALRSALAEIEDYQRVQLKDVRNVVLSASLATDLTLLFAELLENATAFSPPESPVEVSTWRTKDGSCVVGIVDHGIGLPEERLDTENRRLVARERLDITPTSVLGLFVVGRLARRHGLNVRLLATPGGGVTVRVHIPYTHFTESRGPLGPTTAQPQRDPVEVIPPAKFTPGFTWFPEELPAAGAPAPAPVREESRGGLRRRVAGAQLPGVPAEGTTPPGPPRQHDVVATRNQLAGFQAGTALAKEAPSSRGGLSRRVPGRSMASALHNDSPAKLRERTDKAWKPRDPEADRDQLSSFVAGFARATTDAPKGNS